MNAGVGVTGPAIRSTSLERLVEILANQPADLERLQVIGVVVAGTQGIRAEHDPPLHFGPKPSARAAAIHSHQRIVELVEPRLVAGRFQLLRSAAKLGEHLLLVRAMAEVHAVVAGQIARGFARRDDVVRGHAVLAVRQRNLVDLRAQRFVNLDRLAHRRFDFGVEPGAEMLAHQAEPQIRRAAG